MMIVSGLSPFSTGKQQLPLDYISHTMVPPVVAGGKMKSGLATAPCPRPEHDIAPVTRDESVVYTGNVTGLKKKPWPDVSAVIGTEKKIRPLVR